MAEQIGYVYKKGTLAATLTKESGGLRFAYLPGYKGEAIASTLPLGGTSFNHRGWAPAFFTGLLPEGPRIVAISEQIKASLDDELSLLLVIGTDPIGDVQILPEGVSPHDESLVLKLARDTSELNFEDLRQQYFGKRASGIPGVQDKVSSKMLNARVKTSHQEFIVKFNPLKAPHAVENEYFFLGLARECGIETSDYELLTDSVNQHALRLLRWDRVGENGVSVRLAAEDGCQLADLPPGEKYSLDFVEMVKLFTDMTEAPIPTGYGLFTQLVFNWLIGNGDGHAKNFSVLESPNRGYTIAPAYDLLCTRYYDDRTMALKIDGKDTGWDRAFLVDVAARMQVSEAIANLVIDRQLAVLAKVPDLILGGALPFRRDQNADVAAFLKARAKALA
jgi:serine/threonine-protein kinase HipA